MSTRKIALSREIIAATALAIADKHGFETVTMRRIARELKVGTMSLYYYVKTKDELIAAMDDALMAEALLPSVPQGWRRALVQIAGKTRALFVRHPWALVAMLSAAPGLNALRHMEQCLEALAKTSLTRKQKITLLAMIDDFVFGYALREAAVHSPGGAEFAAAQIETGKFPRLEEIFGNGYIGPSADRFEKGLEAILASVPLPATRSTNNRQQ